MIKESKKSEGIEPLILQFYTASYVIVQYPGSGAGQRRSPQWDRKFCFNHPTAVEDKYLSGSIGLKSLLHSETRIQTCQSLAQN